VCSSASVANWDANSPQLVRNLQDLVPTVAHDAAERKPLSSEVIRQWQERIMRGLEPDDREPIGAYRGEVGLEEYDVAVAGRPGAPAERVSAELANFDRALAGLLEDLDRQIARGPSGERPAKDQVDATIIACAWAHGEWLRIHPFPNGNGRTARLLVNSIALRYGLPAFMRVRPRPGAAYVWVAQRAMDGQWAAAVPFFTELFEKAL
jgi:Fic family protein